MTEENRYVRINVTMRHVPITIVSVENQSITYSERVLVASVTQLAKRMRCAILSSVACSLVPYFSTLTHTKLLNTKCVKKEYQQDATI